MKKRRFLSYTLFVFTVLTLFLIAQPSTVYSAPSGVYFTLSTDVSKAKSGDEVKVSLGVGNVQQIVDEGEQSIDMFSAYITYNPDVYDIPIERDVDEKKHVSPDVLDFLPNYFESKPLMSTAYTVIIHNDKPGVIEVLFGWTVVVLDPTKFFDKDGTLLTMTFTIKEDARGNGDFGFLPDDENEYGSQHFYPIVSYEERYPDLLSSANVAIEEPPLPTSTITFDSKGGTPVDAITAPIGDVVSKPINPTKLGYVFVDWYLSNDGGMTLEADPYVFDVSPTNDVVLYAKFIPIGYTVSFDANGGAGSMTDITAMYDQTQNLPKNTFTRGDDIFLGWSTTPTGNVVYNDEAEIFNLSTTPSTVVLYAQWKSVYTVTLNLNGGLHNSSPDSIAFSKEQNQTYGAELITPTRVGYTFNGWFTALNGGTQISSSSKVQSNQTLYARWTIKQFSITFDTNGGSAVAQITGDYGKHVDQPANPTKTGYTFVGWYSDLGLTSEVTFPFSMPEHNQKFYAKWDINEYTITFETNDDAEVTTITQDYDTAIILPTPTRSNFVFGGWYLDNESFNTKFQLTKMPASNITVYAKWTQEHTVTFDPDNGQANTFRTVLDQQQLGTLPTVTKEGHTFTGWFDESNNPVTASYLVLNTMTVKAKWVAKEYTVAFQTNGGSPIASIQYLYGTQVDQPVDPSKTGHTFVGWYSNAGLTGEVSFPFNIPANNITLYARWDINEYTITFESNNGHGPSIIKQSFDTLLTLPIPTKSGYKFDGWYKDNANFLEKFNLTKMPASDYTVYAKWTQEHTIIFDADNGQTIAPRTVLDQQQLGALPTVTKEGHTLEGWFDESNNPVTASDQVLNSMTLKAKWIVNEYTITFDTNGGLPISAIRLMFGAQVDQPVDPIKTGSTFVGWFSNAALTNEVVFPFAMPSHNQTIYVKWETNQHTVTFVDSGDSVINPITADFNSTITLPTPTKTGYTFGGWFDNDQFVGSAYGASHVVNEDLTLYAKWTINKYKVFFNTNGGNTIDSIEQVYKSQVVRPSDPTKTGHTFVAWYIDASLTTEVVFPFELLANDVTIYAKWETNEYTISFESNGGEEIAQIKQKFGTSLSLPLPTKINSAFVGWFKDDGTFNIPFTSNTMPDESLTLYAKWEDGHTVAFHTVYDNLITTIPVLHGETVQTLPEPTRIGYTFNGWYQNEDYSGLPFTAEAKIYDNLNLYAKWDINFYDVSFVTNSDSVIDAIHQEYGSTITQPIDPVKKGHTFAGWYLESSLDTEVTFPYQITNNVTMYAKWTLNNHTISFGVNDGTIVESISGDFGTTIVLPTPSKTGYSFAGWYETEDFSGTKHLGNYLIQKDVLLYGKWTLINHTVAFEVNDGTILESINGDYGTTIVLPTPIKVGHTFAGWFQEEDFSGSAILGSFVVTQDVVLYAKWTANMYRVVFEVHGGSPIAEVNNIAGFEILQPVDPTRAGYVFLGWFMESELLNEAAFPYAIPTQDTTLYAKWEVVGATDRTLTEIQIKVNGEIVELVSTIESEMTIVLPYQANIVDIVPFAKVASTTVEEILDLVLLPGEVSKQIITVTSLSGDTTEYILNLTRSLPSTNSFLDALVISNSDNPNQTYPFNEVFDPQRLEYSIIVGPDVNQLFIAPELQVGQSKFELRKDGVEVLNPVTIVPGDQLFEVLVTAEDGITTTKYQITVQKQELNSNPYLRSITIVGSNDLNYTTSLDPMFKPDVLNYRLIVPYVVTSLTFTGVGEESGAITSGTTRDNLLVGPTANTHQVVVTAEDGSKVTYTFEITRLSKSSDASLDRIEVGNTAISVEDGVLVYTLDLPYAFSKVFMKPIANNFYVSNLSINQGTIQSEYVLALGDNDFEIVVVAEDGVTKLTYLVTINRLPASSDATIVDMAVDGAQETVFKKKEPSGKFTDTTFNQRSYIQYIFVKPEDQLITMNPVVGSNGRVKNNQDLITSLDFGYNIVPITVVAEDEVTETNYFFIVYRPNFNNEAGLKALTVNNASFERVSADIYRVHLEKNISELDLTVLLNDEAATYTITGNSNLRDDSIVTIEVVAADGITTQTYTLYCYTPAQEVVDDAWKMIGLIAIGLSIAFAISLVITRKQYY